MKDTVFSAAFRRLAAHWSLHMCSSSRYNFSLKGHANTPSSMGYNDCNLPSLHLPWSMPLPYSSSFYQNQDSSNQRFDETMYTGVLPITSESSKVAGIKRSHFDGQISKPVVDKDVGSGFGAWDLSSKSPLASILTEDDFLNMVLGNYLSSSNKLFCSSSFYFTFLLVAHKNLL